MCVGYIKNIDCEFIDILNVELALVYVGIYFSVVTFFLFHKLHHILHVAPSFP